MFKRIFSLLLFISIVVAHFELVAQHYPIQATTRLIPPYSVYLADYAAPGNEKLRVILMQKDLTQATYQLRLVVNIELNGNIIMRTSRLYHPAPIVLDPGIPTIITGNELFPYLDSRNLDFIGYSRSDYERTRALPEGSYRISFTCYDYHRQDVQVSNEGSSFYWLAKDEPPLINFPACGTRVPSRDPQQIVFTWLPRNTASPNSADQTEYEVALYETRPAGRNPNDVVLSTPPMFRVTTTFTQLVYGPGEPLLLEGMTYVWRVQARDAGGRDAFRNNGYSEVCWFTYGGPDPNFTVGAVQGLQAQGETERRARIWWQQTDFDNYRIEYHKPGKDNEWFRSEAKGTELKLYDLEPDTEYETRMQASKDGVYGPYTDVVKFRTTPVRVMQCGQPTPQWPTTPGQPLLSITPGMVINARGLDMSIRDAQPNGGDGWYKGFGRVAVPFFGGASYTVKFDRIYIDVDRNVVNGRIDFVTQGVADMMEQQLAAQKERQKAKKARDSVEASTPTTYYPDIIMFDSFRIDTITVTPQGDILLTDSDDELHTTTIATIRADNPGKAIIVEDKDGQKWEINKNGVVSKTVETAPNAPKAIDMSKLDDFEKLLKSALDTLITISKNKSDSLSGVFDSNLKNLKEVIEDNGYDEFLFSGPGAAFFKVGMSKKVKPLNPEKLKKANDIDKGILSIYYTDLLIQAELKRIYRIKSILTENNFKDFRKKIETAVDHQSFDQISTTNKIKLLIAESTKIIDNEKE